MIDFHTHPLLVREMIKKYPELAHVAREVFYIRNNFQPLETFHLELDVAGLERAVILPIDATTTKGFKIYSNEQIAELCKMSDRLIGFASVDPHQKGAVKDLEHAIKKLKLRGLKLSPSTQEFYPHDEKLMFPIYEKAQSLGIPILFHAGMSWEPQVKAKFGQPIYFEDVAFQFPKLKIVIAHFAWPWVLEAVMLALKYPNVYIDTSCLYFDNPVDFVNFVMTKQVPLTVIERSLRNQIVFGSNYPRVEIKNMVKAVKSLELSEGCLELVFRKNAERLLGEGLVMKIKLEKLEVQTRKDQELVDMTPEVERIIKESGVKNGVVNIMTTNTSSGIVVTEGLPCLEMDVLNQLEKLAPDQGNYYHNRYLDIDGRLGFNAGAHLRGVLSGYTAFFPIEDGKIVKGSRQRIYFAEYDGPLARTCCIQVLGE